MLMLHFSVVSYSKELSKLRHEKSDFEENLAALQKKK